VGQVTFVALVLLSLFGNQQFLDQTVLG